MNVEKEKSNLVHLSFLHNAGVSPIPQMNFLWGHHDKNITRIERIGGRFHESCLYMS